MGPLKRERGPGSLASRDCHARVALAIAVLLIAACASPPRGGFEHEVRAGENLFRIGQRYGVPAEVLREVNGISDVRELSVGQKLWIPAVGDLKARPAVADRRIPQATLRQQPSMAFRWPVNGRVTSRFGRRRGSPHEGIDIAAPRGTEIRAAEAGKVIFAGRMSDYGRLVVVKHSGNYRSVYAHLKRMAVKKGAFVDRGDLIGEVGTSGNATGPHLHFEIRQHDRARDPILYLP